MAEVNAIAERVRALFVYNEESGVFTNRYKRGRAKEGAVAGCICHRRGHIILTIDNHHHLAHRVAFLYVTGQWPGGVVDHRDGDNANNRWSNLRDVTQGINLQNQRRARSDSASGFLGVFRNRKKWTARVKTNGVNVNLGQHDTPEQAHQAYLEAKRIYHKGCTI